MSIEIFNMPHLGESVTEASISQWLVSVGDQVERFDPIAEAVSDKVTTEIPSDFTGTIKEILIETDVEVEIGTPILKVDTASSEATEETTEEVIEKSSAKEVKTTTTTDSSNETTRTDLNEQKTDASGKRYSPAVRRIAHEKGLDLAQVEGSGRHGRIARRDVEAISAEDLQSTTDETVQSPPSTPSAQEEQPDPSEQVSEQVGQTTEDSSTSSQASDSSQFQAAQSKSVPQSSEESKVVKADPVRKAIAKKMTQSVNEIPHAWMMVEVDVSNIVELRNQVKEPFNQTENVKLSFFPFFVKAVTQAIKKHPIMNTSWDDGHIIYHKDINISIAVGSEEGLFVPVIKQADNYSISGLAKEIDRLASGARAGTLSNDDIQGGTMTVNNTGVFGSTQSMGIINHPQAAILQVEKIQKKVVPTDDGGFRFAHMVNLCLSMDHRILDGLAAGQFLADVKQNLSHFQRETDIY